MFLCAVEYSPPLDCKKVSQQNSVLPKLDRGQRDVLFHMARDYPKRDEHGGSTVVERLAAQALRSAFHNTAVRINPSFAVLTDKELWMHARPLHKVIVSRDSARLPRQRLEPEGEVLQYVEESAGYPPH